MDQNNEDLFVDEEISRLSEYVSELVDCGFDAMDLPDIEKRFPLLDDCSGALTKLGCVVVEDLVILKDRNYTYD